MLVVLLTWSDVEKLSVLKEKMGISDDSEAIMHLIMMYAEALDEG